MSDHSPKVVVITGAARGIGFGLALEFLQRGHCVMICDLHHESVHQAVDTLEKTASSVAGRTCDVTDPKDLQDLWRAAVDEFDRVDIWINNAGVGSDQSDIIDTPIHLLQRVVDTNIKGVVYGTQVALQGMREQGGGAIYNTAGFGSDGFWRRGMTIYGTSKRAVAYFSKGVAKEVAAAASSQAGSPLVCWLNPGMVITPLVIEEARTMPSEKWKAGRRVFNMWGETIETTAQQLVERILDNQKNGVNIHLLPGWKMAWKALCSLVVRRDLFAGHGV